MGRKIGKKASFTMILLRYKNMHTPIIHMETNLNKKRRKEIIAYQKQFMKGFNHGNI